MRKYLFPQNTPHPALADQFTFQTLRAVLPLAAIATVVMSLAVVLLYQTHLTLEAKLIFLLPMFGLATLFSYLSYRALPRVTHPKQVDHIAAIATVATAGVMCVGVISGHDFSPLPIALLVITSTTLYHSNRQFAVFTVFALGLDMASQLIAGRALSPMHYLGIVLIPMFALLTRISLTYLHRQATDSRNALRSKVAELEAEKALRTETEAQFRQAQKLEGLGQLATGVAHDFNNYLYVISLMAEDMQMDDPNNDKLAVILSSTKGASGICDRMLSYAGRTTTASKHYDIAALAREIQPVICAAIPKSVSVQFDISAQPQFTVGDPTIVSQCLTNLVNNSFESIQGPNGTILVSVFRSELASQLSPGWRLFGSTDEELALDSQVVVIEVSDTGQGMTDAVLDRAFDPYFSTKGKPGHGFGLAITLGIVRGAGGHLICNTAPDSGTTIQILLPRTATPLIAANSATSQEPQPRLRRLLLVDDEQSVRESARDLLSKVGYQVTLAPSANAARGLLSNSAHQFDVILADYTMPDETGLELLNRLREGGSKTPFILCSGYEPHSIAGLDAVKPDAFLHKPFRLTQFEEVLVNIGGNPNNPGDLRSVA